MMLMLHNIKRFSVLSSIEKFGFIGLGQMGHHMAVNIAKNKNPLVVCDINEESKNRFISTLKNENVDTSKITFTSKPRDLIEVYGSKYIITMLPSTPQVKSVFEDANEGLLAAKCSTKTFLIDCTTLNAHYCSQLEKKALAKGMAFVDAPVSGGTNGARDGTLTFMVGGADATLQEIRPIFHILGENVIHCGPVGSGQAAKITNNLLLAISMIGTSEAMLLGQRLGLDPKVIAHVLNTSSGRCWSSQVYNPVPGVLPGVPSSRNYEGGFATHLIHKDLGLAMDAIEACGIKESPMGKLSRETYSKAMELKFGSKDFSVIYQMLKESNE